jgi:DeoR family fructose operon transcriptional repressor
VSFAFDLFSALGPEKNLYMPKQLYMEERRRQILDKLNEFGRVSVNDLSEWLDVSAVTIRQDLRALEQEHRLERTHGGAVLRQESSSSDLSFEVRNRVNHGAKDAIARRAASIVKSGDSIALDASTTCFRMLPYLKQLERLIVVTNSLMISQNLLDSSHIDVFMPGGQLRRDSISLVGKPDELPNINLNYGFFGANGASKNAGITESSRAEVEIKQGIMSNCLEVFFLLDHTKWGKVTPFTLAHATDETASERYTIITSKQAPVDEVRVFQQSGIRFLLVGDS